MSWICCHPIFDDVTVITDDESKDAIDYLNKHEIKVIDLPDDKTVKNQVEKALKENPTANIGHWDHGNEEAWIGDDEKPVLDLGNANLLKGREAFASNCSSAKKLGVEAFKQGCKAYFGYKDVVSFTTDALEEFKEAFNYWIKRRIDGFSPMDALQKTKDKMTELVDQLLESGRVLAAACMRRNRDIVDCYTPDNPPQESDCFFRRHAINLFGPKTGWRLTREFPLALFLFLIGFVITLHNLVESIGLGLVLMSFLLLTWDYIRSLKKTS